MDGSGQGRMGNVAVDNGGRAVMRRVRGRVVVRRHRRAWYVVMTVVWKFGS